MRADIRGMLGRSVHGWLMGEQALLDLCCMHIHGCVRPTWGIYPPGRHHPSNHSAIDYTGEGIRVNHEVSSMAQVLLQLLVLCIVLMLSANVTLSC